MFSRLEQQFSKVIARDAVSVLKQSIRSGGTVLAVGGNQLTGKSTLAERLAHRFGGKSVSCGSTFRQEAARRNVSVAELSKMALNDPSIDATIEYNVAMQIAGKEQARGAVCALLCVHVCGVISLSDFLCANSGLPPIICEYVMCLRSLQLVPTTVGYSF
jgi:hypothetical protein